MFDIITFGSATWDIFLRPKKFQVLKDKKFVTGKGICFNLGSKIEVKDIYFSSGGGGTNTAATFSNQGFKVAYCGQVGDDISGREIITELKKLRINVELILKTKEKPTNHSIILSIPKEDRTILVYRGASELLSKKNIPWQKLKAKWFYLAPLSGRLANLTEDLVNFAHKNKIKVAANLGNSQINLGMRVLKPILAKINILILNQEETSLLTKVPFQKEKKIFQKLDKLVPGIAVMTKGKKGVVVSDGKYIWQAETFLLKVIEKTGAGDAFGAGFLTGFIRKNDISYAIQLATANATSCIQKIGAKNGLLKKVEKFKRVRVQKRIL